MAQGNQLQKRNLASEAFRKKYDALSDALAQPDVASWLAIKLYTGAIITVETRDAIQMTAGITPAKQASLLLQAVESSIKIDHTRLRKFTRLMKKKPVLEPIARQLHQRYSALVSEARLTESSSSGSDTDSTEQHQSQALPGSPVLSMLDQHEQEAEDGREGYTRTQSWIKGLEGQYRDLVKKAQKEVMKQEPDLDEFRTEITLLPTSFREEHIRQYIKDNLPQLYEAKSIPQIFGLLNIRWNYLHYDLLQHIIDLYGSDDTKELMKGYIKNVRSFQQETTLAMFWEADPGHMSDMAESSREKLAKVVTRHKDLTSGSLLKSIEAFRLKFAREISLPECALVMKDILPGSVVIVWLIPAKGAITLKNQVEKGTIEFFKQHHILELRIDDVTIYSSGSQHLSSTAETGQGSGMTMPEVQQRQLTTRSTELHTLQQTLQSSLKHIHTLQQELRDSHRKIKELTHQVEMKDQQLQSKEKVLLQHEQTISELQTAIDQLERKQAQLQMEEKQHATEERERQAWELTKHLLEMKQPEPLLQKTGMQQKEIQDMRWQKSKAPQSMSRGSAAIESNIAYFNGYGTTTVHSYDSDTQEWRQLPDAPHTHSTLVVIRHILTMVGGLISDRATNSLLSLMGEGRDKSWLPNLPAMPTKRYFTAAVCSSHSLIVAGGEDDSNTLATVEVLDTDTRQWSIASSLTHPFTDATISICGERLYMLGGWDDGYITRSVLSCSIPELLQSCQTQLLAGKLRTAPANKSIWRYVADATHYYSSCATLCGRLVAVGGWEALKYTSAITGYNETTDSWEVMGHMPTARWPALVAILNGKMMVVGGSVVGGSRTDVVEILS